jgi:hypothetical protein
LDVLVICGDDQAELRRVSGGFEQLAGIYFEQTLVHPCGYGNSLPSKVMQSDFRSNSIEICVSLTTTRKALFMPIFSYFLVVGLILAGLLYCANAVIIPGPVKFGGSQKIGLPDSYKAPIVADFPGPIGRRD